MKTLTQQRKKKAIKLFNDGYTVAQIALLCGVSDKTVWRYLGGIRKKK
jgi:DNA-binding CsgD family transcriptional regulator